jgi:hypothetical protein
MPTGYRSWRLARKEKENFLAKLKKRVIINTCPQDIAPGGWQEKKKENFLAKLKKRVIINTWQDGMPAS